jgi:hypothetical protein
MKLLLRFAGAAFMALALVPWAAPQVPQAPQGHPPHQRSPAQDDANAPNGSPQQDEILKADHEKDLKDAAQLIDLAEQLKQELEKNDRHVLSISSLKKTEEIEKLAKRIHSRLVH